MSAIDTNMAPSQLMGGNLQGVAGPMDPFVSPGQTPGVTSAYQKRPYHTQNRVDAHTDRALRIRDSTEKVAWLYQQNWQTSEVFPLRTVQNLVLTVEHFEAYPTFFSVTPEQAVSHMVTQSNTVTEVKLVRWSLQAKLTQGWLDEDLGQRRYAAMLNQFGTSMNETANADFARALLTASDPQQTWLRRHGEMNIEDMHNFMRWDVFIFGALQKIADNPLEKINQKVKSMMKRYMGEADVIIMSEDLQIYAELVPLRKTRYIEGGQEAVDRVNGRGPGTDANTGGIQTHIDPIRWLQDNRIYIHRSQVVEGQGDMDPWSRRRQIGEWNMLDTTQITDWQNYRSSQRTIFVYNQDQDVMSPITMRDLILNCNMFKNDAAGTLKTLGEDETAGLSVRYNRDAKYFPFAVKANSYKPIKLCGDLSASSFNMTDINNLAITMMNSAYRDVPSLKEIDAIAVSAVLDEAARRKRGGNEEQAGEVTWAQISGYAPAADANGRNAADIFNQFGNRMRAIMGGSIFLDPANSTATSNGTAGRTLYETLVLADAVPIFRGSGDSGSGSEQEAAFNLLAESLRSLVDPAQTDVITQINRIIATSGGAQGKIDQIAAVLRANIDKTRVGDLTQLNALIQESARAYREDVAQAGSGGRTGAVDRDDLFGYISPGAPLPAGTVLGYARAGVGGFTEERAPRIRPTRADGDGDFGGAEREDEEDEEFFQEGFESRGDDDDVAQGEFGAQGEFNAQMPVSLRSVPFFGQVIDAAISNSTGGGSLGLAGMRMQARFSGGGSRLGSATERIGAHVSDQQRFAQQSRERGFISAAARRLGLAGKNTAQILASIETLGSNLQALSRHGMSAFRKVLGVIYLGTPFTRSSLLSFYNNDIHIPVAGIVARPHITVQTRIIAKCQSGGGAGFTYYAYPNVMVGDSVLTKTHTINMTFWLRCHVHAPRNVFIIPDVYVNGYHGGMGVEPILSKAQYDPNGMAPGAPCAFFFMCSHSTNRQNVPNPFDISGHMNYKYRMRGASQGSASPAYDSAAFYATMFGLDGNMSDLPMLQQAHVNTYCYRGHQLEWGGNGHTKVMPNTGHWGPKVYEGCKKVREGELYVLETPAWAGSSVLAR